MHFSFKVNSNVPGSRLKDDFDMLEKLGQGGFGEVLKVDSSCYHYLNNINTYDAKINF